jgi:hypothetical protein
LRHKDHPCRSVNIDPGTESPFALARRDIDLETLLGTETPGVIRVDMDNGPRGKGT